MQKVIVLPKDDQEVEELMLEEVEVFKVGGPAWFWTLGWVGRGPREPMLSPALF